MDPIKLNCFKLNYTNYFLYNFFYIFNFDAHECPQGQVPDADAPIVPLF